jgi:hypothetical protein
MFEFIYLIFTDKDFYSEHIAQFFLFNVIPVATFWAVKAVIKHEKEMAERENSKDKSKEKPWHGGYDL